MTAPLSANRRPDSRATDKDGTDWGRVLLWFMRVMAVVWLLKGLAAWAIILDINPLGPGFEALPPSQRAVVIVFAVLDLVAGVGLWLTSAWGGVMWLLAVMTDISAFALGAPAPSATPVFIGLEFALVVLYLVLSWLASRNE